MGFEALIHFLCLILKALQIFVLKFNFDACLSPQCMISYTANDFETLPVPNLCPELFYNKAKVGRKKEKCARVRPTVEYL